MNIKIVLVDDHTLVLHGLKEKLETIEQFQVVGTFSEGSSLLQSLEHLDVDIMILDFMLKEMNGFELIQKVRQKSKKEIKFILISGFYEEILHKRALDLDVKAFIRKESSYEELISCIFSVANGNHVIPDFLVTKEEKQILTEIERKVLNLIVLEYTNEAIARELFISRRTVENHVTNICRKLGVQSRIGAVREAIRLNLE